LLASSGLKCKSLKEKRKITIAITPRTPLLKETT
jgi:hypothetical protein